MHFSIFCFTYCCTVLYKRPQEKMIFRTILTKKRPFIVIYRVIETGEVFLMISQQVRGVNWLEGTGPG